MLGCSVRNKTWLISCLMLNIQLISDDIEKECKSDDYCVLNRNANVSYTEHKL